MNIMIPHYSWGEICSYQILHAIIALCSNTMLSIPSESLYSYRQIGNGSVHRQKKSMGGFKFFIYIQTFCPMEEFLCPFCLFHPFCPIAEEETHPILCFFSQRIRMAQCKYVVQMLMQNPSLNRRGIRVNLL
jgi:hypothetical protein